MNPIDDHDVISQAESDEEILTFDVSDAAPERTASTERQAFTWIYCTGAWQYCPAYADAMLKLGVLFATGQGLPQDYAKAREWYEKAAAKDEPAKVEAVETKRDGKPGEQTAAALNEVIWYAVFAKDFTKALTVADRAHALFPDSLGIETNRAHALLFMAHDEEAKALYLAHKGESVSEADNKSWEQGIAEDFAKLRKAGRTR